MLVLDSEQKPHATPTDFRESDKERDERRMLQVGSINGVKYPIKSQNWIDEDGKVVGPNTLVRQRLAEVSVLCRRIEQTPIHDHVPNAAVYCIRCCAKDEESFEFSAMIDAV